MDIAWWGQWIIGVAFVLLFETVVMMTAFVGVPVLLHRLGRAIIAFVRDAPAR